MFGLRVAIRPAVPWPTPSATATDPDITVYLDCQPPWLSPDIPHTTWFSSPMTDASARPIVEVDRYRAPGGFAFTFADDTRFWLDEDARTVWTRWPAHLTVEDTLTYLLGPILGFALRRRGMVCLHASAVAVDGAALVLLGSAGSGKSTTAAALAQAGHAVLTDDVMVLREEDHGFVVVPGYDRLRLWPEAVDTLYGSRDALPRLTPTWDKRYLDVSRNGYLFQSTPLPLGGVYVLNDRTDDARAPYVTALDGADRLMTLIANTYSYEVFDREMRVRELDVLARVAERYPVRRVTPHSAPQKLTQLVSTLTRDFKTARC